MAAFAYVFHWQPSEIDNLEIEDFAFWQARLDEIAEANKKGANRGR